MTTILNAPNGEKTTPVATDTVPLGDDYYAQLQNILKIINGLTADAPDGAADYGVFYDVSASAAKKSLLNDLIILSRGSIEGYTLSNNGSDANNDIDIAAGRVSDSSGAQNMVLASTLTKRLDASWAVGTNQGGLDTGTKANSTWYQVFVIKRTDTGVVDALFSTSVSSPTMPANYTLKRRIGAIKTDGSGNILAFLQYGDQFLWLSPPALDVDGTITTSRSTHTLASVPSGFVVLARLNVLIKHASAALRVYLSNPNLTDLAPSITATPLSNLTNTTGGTQEDTRQIDLYTDASAQICARSTSSNTTFRVAVLGWTDPRGKY